MLDNYSYHISKKQKQMAHSKYEALADQVKSQIRTLHQIYKIKVCDIINKPEYQLKEILKNVPKSTIYNLATSTTKDTKDMRLKNENAGRKSVYTSKDKRLIRRAIIKLHAEQKNFTAKELQSLCNFEAKSSSVTFRRTLQSMGYHYLVNRKKGILNQNDKDKRVAFAKQIRTNYGRGKKQLEYWSGIALYTDIVGYEWKVNQYFSFCKNV